MKTLFQRFCFTESLCQGSLESYIREADDYQCIVFLTMQAVFGIFNCLAYGITVVSICAGPVTKHGMFFHRLFIAIMN